MPTYEYRCEQCTHQFEVFARMSDPDPEACESCGGGPLVKVLFPVAVHYKGSGFYSTDYSGTKASGASEGGSAAAASSDTAPSGGDKGASSSDSSAGSGSAPAKDSGSSASSTSSSSSD